MTKVSILILCFFLFASCSENNKNNGNTKAEIAQRNAEMESHISDYNNPIFQNWMNYYTNSNAEFSIKKFKFETTRKLNISKGEVHGIFDPGFDKKYTDFLVYSPDKSNYVDFDSDQWTLDKDKDNKNSIKFGGNQEVNLVNIPAKTIKRILSLGSISWIEDAFWKNDSIVVLLGNNNERIPSINEVDIKNSTISRFIYERPLSKDSKYAQERIERKLKGN